MGKVIYLEDKIKNNSYNLSFYLENFYFNVKFYELKKLNDKLNKYFQHKNIKYNSKLAFITSENNISNDSSLGFEKINYHFLEEEYCEDLFNMSLQTSIILFCENKRAKIILSYLKSEPKNIYIDGKNLSEDEFKILKTINMQIKKKVNKNYDNKLVEKLFE